MKVTKVLPRGNNVLVESTGVKPDTKIIVMDEQHNDASFVFTHEIISLGDSNKSDLAVGQKVLLHPHAQPLFVQTIKKEKNIFINQTLLNEEDIVGFEK